MRLSLTDCQSHSDRIGRRGHAGHGSRVHTASRSIVFLSLCCVAVLMILIKRKVIEMLLSPGATCSRAGLNSRMVFASQKSKP